MDPKETLKKYLKRIPKPFNSILENGDKADYFEGLDIEKPESLSPMDMELRIQADRVMFSLNKAVAVLSVMAHIPFFLEEDAHLLKEVFSDKEIQYIGYVLKLYDVNHSQEAHDHIPGMNELFDVVTKIRHFKFVARNRISEADANLSQVIHMLFTNKCLRQKIKTAQNPEVIPFLVQFIKDFEELKAMAKIKLYITGTEEETRDKRLRQAYKSNLILIAAIKDLEQQLKSQREQLGNELSKKVEIFEKYNNKIAKVREEFKFSIDRNIHESERKMMQQRIESDEKQTVLTVEAETVTKQYDNLLEDHLIEEKKSRAKTKRTETQLQNWLTKYDQDIGEKQAEYEDLKAQYDTEKATIDDLAEKMEEQEQIYDTLMSEKAEEEERIFQELAWKMLINRSARIIQRAWLSYRERKAKRKGKKGKKGKEEKKRTRLTKKDDPNAVLQKTFKPDVFEEMKNDGGFG